MLSDDQRRFIDEFVTLLAGWNMPANGAQVYGYLLFQNHAASLDEIAEALEISKSNACKAAKMLEDKGHIRRVGERGSKRVLYVVREDFGTPFLHRTASLGALSRLMETRGARSADGEASERIASLASFYAVMQTAMEQIIAADTERAEKSV
jgi:DNA-binding transcriptional regulator GbsR (MarR family)